MSAEYKADLYLARYKGEMIFCEDMDGLVITYISSDNTICSAYSGEFLYIPRCDINIRCDWYISVYGGATYILCGKLLYIIRQRVRRETQQPSKMRHLLKMILKNTELTPPPVATNKKLLGCDIYEFMRKRGHLVLMPMSVKIEYYIFSINVDN